ncbi:hypothetical protein [Oleidesulfovibrio sp.]|uniref:hypothetical protein n=1 Tax=Oleidesulfovibrio sp. TaxID=2909707 RepID=UPI003A8C330A
MNKRDFKELFEIIYDKFISSFADGNWPESKIGFSKFLAHEHNGKVQAWSKGQWPSAYDCWILHQKMGFNLEWLLTGQGVPVGNKVDNLALPLTHQAKIVDLERENAQLREMLDDKRKLISLYEKREQQIPLIESCEKKAGVPTSTAVSCGTKGGE